MSSLNDAVNGPLPQIAKRITSVASDIVTVRTATVVSDGAAPKDTLVALDNDPAQTPINALGLNFSLDKGTRVVCLAYPPRGLIVLGAIADASGGSVSEITLLCEDTDQEMIIDCESIQTLTAAIGSTLFLNPAGGTVQTGAGLVATGEIWAALGDVRINSNQIWANANGHLYANFSSTGNFYMGTNGLVYVSNGSLVAGTDITAGSQVYAGAQFRAGNQAAANAVLNGNHLYERTGGVNGGTLNINSGVGAVSLGGDLTVNGRIDTLAPTGAAGLVCSGIAAGGGYYRLRITTSTRRHKENIRDLDEYSVEQILSLKPRTFQRNDETIDVPVPSTETDRESTWITLPAPVTEDSPWYPGFIAEEAVDLGLDLFVVRDESQPEAEKISGFTYDHFAAVAHQIVLRAHQRKIEELEAKNAQIEDRLARLEAHLGLVG